MDIKEIEEKYIGKAVKYAGAHYECCGVVDLFGCIFLEIYDEPPSNHVDMIKLSSIEFDSAP
jgi:hypothetical protein